MRDFKGMKRQRSRNRGGGGNGGGGKPQHNVNRAFDSNGPDNVKIRGHAQHVFEKYQQLARDAFSGGDRVLAENYLQHADHYFRVLRTLQPQRPASEILGRDVFASGLDIDFEDEGEGFDETADGGDQGEPGGGELSRPEQRYDAPRNDAPRNEGRREDRYDNRRNGEERYESRRDNQDARGEFRRDDRYEARQGQGQNQSSTQGQGQGQSQGQEPRRDGRNDNRGDGRNDNRGDGRGDNRRMDGRRDREGRNDAPRRYEAGASDPNEQAPAEDGRSRPMIQDTDQRPPGGNEASPVLRSHDGEISEAPAFLQSQGADEAMDARRPRVRRRRSRVGDESGDASPGVDVAEEA